VALRNAEEYLVAVAAAANQDADLGAGGWTVLKEIDDQELTSGAIAGPTLALDIDSESEGEFADPDVPGVVLAALLIVPIVGGTTTYAGARKKVAAGVRALRDMFSSTTGLISPERIRVGYARGTVAGGAKAATAAVSLEFDSIT
jgi:hypothetical protein